jgi:aminoglycoside phosphotransferase family enzyme
MSSTSKINAGQRRQMIAEAAYFRAERRGFNGGDPLRDWCEAEAEVDAQLRQFEDDRLLERIEEGLAAANQKLSALKRKVAHLSADARIEWQKDVDKLAILRDALRPKLAELREQGEHAGQKVWGQAEKLRAELAEAVHRIQARAKH